ncbi:hypothetical protein ACJX0J_040277, partial [Zea mays]
MADMVSEVAGQGARPALRWTAVMSGFVLRRFVDLIGNGVKTDKGFKEIHLNSVAKNVSEFCGQEVTGQQVYNHLRKWRSRWVKVCKLKDISGALWDEDNFVISLEEGHYAAYIKGTPGEFMTDEDVAVEALILSDVTDLPTHHLCCFAVFGLATLLILITISDLHLICLAELYILFA